MSPFIVLPLFVAFVSFNCEVSGQAIPYMKLEILRGEVNAHDALSRGDAFVQIFVGGNFVGRTSTVSNSLRPKWKDSFRLENITSESTFFFWIFDEDFFTPNDEIDEVRFQFKDVLSYNGKEFSVKGANTRLDNSLVLRLTWVSPENCGRSFSKSGLKLSSGQTVGTPWQVSLRVKGNNGSQHFCGGSIINKRYVLTAAHCLMGKDAQNISLHVGNNYSQESASEGKYEIRSIKIHPRFSRLTFTRDLALIQTKKVIHFNEHVNALCLPSVGFTPLPNTGVAIGWKSDHTLSPMTSQVNLTIGSDDDCHQRFKSQRKGRFWSDEHMICAFGLTSDTVKGDSGGPLFVHFKGAAHLIGVTSWGIPGVASSGSNTSFPGAYADVAYDMDWIEDNAHDF